MLKEYGTKAAEKDTRIRTRLPVFLWIVDDKEAVFSIPTYNSGVTEFGFRTFEPDLVAALALIWNRYQKDAEPFDPNAPDDDESTTDAAQGKAGEAREMH